MNGVAENGMSGSNENQLVKREKETCISPWRVFMDFSRNTSLHGLKYLSETISVIEKLFWFITIIISIVLCFFLIYNVWYKWRHSPVIVSFNEQIVPVWKVPFPAVTICPQIKCKKTVYDFSYALSNWTEKTDDIGMVCSQDELSIKIGYTNFRNVTLVDNIRQVAPTIEDSFKSCTWRELDDDDLSYLLLSLDCESLFKEVLTNEGVCYTFNTLSEDEMFHKNSIQQNYKYLHSDTPANGWSFKNGYEPGKFNSSYPWMGQENSAKPDLSIIFKENIKDRDDLCNSFNRGYKVYIHHPADMPTASLYYYAVMPSHVTALAVKFNMISTSHTLETYPANVRQCYFPKDRTLKYFKEYTQNNCEIECLSNRTFESCKCVWYNMPHNNGSQLCGTAKEKCVKRAKREMIISEIEAALKAEAGDDTIDACRCLPPCNSVTYDAEVLKTEFALKTYDAAINRFIELNDTSMDNYVVSRLVVYFKEARFVSMRRSELFGLTDFLANCGGLLGLFLGFSFLSLIEIFYFPTLRVYFSIVRGKVAPKSDSPPNKQD